MKVPDVADLRDALQRRVILEVGGQHAHLAAGGVDDGFDQAARHTGGAVRIGRPWQQMTMNLRDPEFRQQQVAELARQVVLVDFAVGSATEW